MCTVPVSPENPYRVLTILGTVPASPQKHTTTKPHVSVAIVARVAESASLPQPSQSSLALAMPAVHSTHALMATHHDYDDLGRESDERRPAKKADR